MDTELYDQFLELKNLGRKGEAKTALGLFIASFETLGEKQAWVFSFLKQGNYGHRIRHELYEALIYPVLLAGYLEQDANSVAWLARTASNLYALKAPHPALKGKAAFALFKEAYALEPNAEVQADLLDTLLHWFSFSQHEWPAGILYGMNGANVEQCGYILQEVDFARQLDHNNQHASYFSDFEAKVKAYMARLREREVKGESR